MLTCSRCGQHYPFCGSRAGPPTCDPCLLGDSLDGDLPWYFEPPVVLVFGFFAGVVTTLGAACAAGLK